MSDLPPPPPPPPASFPPAGGAPGGADVGSAFSYALKKFKEHAGALIVIAIVVFAVQILFAIVSNGVDSFIGRVIMQGLGLMLGAFVGLGVARAALMVTDGQQPSVGTVFKTDKLGAYFIASILYGLATRVGLLLCFVGVLIPMVLFAFYPYFVLDKGEGPTQALASSLNLVKNNLGTTILLLVVAAVLGFVGALACGIGLLVTIPMAQIMVAYGYKRLTNQQVAA
jgi:uncharacterized membrane protein